jgi:hypothetical protein
VCFLTEVSGVACAVACVPEVPVRRLRATEEIIEHCVAYDNEYADIIKMLIALKYFSCDSPRRNEIGAVSFPAEIHT